MANANLTRRRKRRRRSPPTPAPAAAAGGIGLAVSLLIAAPAKAASPTGPLTCLDQSRIVVRLDSDPLNPVAICVVEAKYADIASALQNTTWYNDKSSNNEMAMSLANAISQKSGGRVSAPTAFNVSSAPWSTAWGPTANLDNNKYSAPYFLVKSNSNNLKAVSYTKNSSGGFVSSSGYTPAGSTPSRYVILQAQDADGVPGPLPLMGAGAAFTWSRRLRRRTRLRPLSPCGADRPCATLT